MSDQARSSESVTAHLIELEASLLEPDVRCSKTVSEVKVMCRNIKTLYNFEPPATEDEIRAAALHFVRKISGFAAPSAANHGAFERAVDGTGPERQALELRTEADELAGREIREDRLALGDEPHAPVDCRVAEGRAPVHGDDGDDDAFFCEHTPVAQYPDADVDIDGGRVRASSRFDG